MILLVCTVTLPALAEAGDAGEQIFKLFLFFALLQPRSIKKENPQRQ